MRKVIKKLIPMFLMFMLIVNTVYIAYATTNNNNDSIANVIDMQFSLSEYDTTYDNGINTYWKIVLTFDKKVGFGSSSYWQKNLQQYMVESQSTEKDNWEEHNALADILRNKIYINGMSIEEGLNNDPVNQGLSTRIQIGDGKYSSTNNKLMIYVRAEFIAQMDNVYGLNDFTDFTFEIKDGIILNDYTINPIKYKYHSDTQLITVDDGTLSVDSVYFDKNYDYEGIKCSLFKVKLSDKIDDNTVFINSLYEKILINEKSIEEGLGETENSTFVYFGNNASGDANMLYIAVKSDNDPYGLDVENSFTISFNEGIKFGEYSLNPNRYYFSLKTNRMVSDDSVEFISVTLSEASSYVTSGVERGPVWVITLKTSPEDNIQVINKNVSYWGLNLQQKMTESQGDYYQEHNTQADILRSRIFINGISVDSALKATNECTTLINTPDANTLIIRINKSQDKYGIDLEKGFSLSLRSGLKIGDKKIYPSTYVYTQDSFKLEDSLSNGEVSSDTNIASVDSVKLIEGTSCSNNHSIDNWIVEIDFNKEIYDGTVADKRGENTDFYTSHLQTDGWLSDLTSSYTELRRYILINGKCLTDIYIDGNYNSWDEFVHISTDEKNKQKLTIAIPKDNTFDFNGSENFDITILNGIVLNNYNLSSKKISFKEDKVSCLEITEEENAEYSRAMATGASIETVNKRYCSNHSSDSQWVLTIDFDKNLYASDVYSPVSGGPAYYRRHLQASGWTATADKESSSEEILNLISLNGKTLKECYSECTTRPFSDIARFIHVSSDDALGKTLKIAIPTSNPYGFDGLADFEVVFGKGLIINGYNINPFILSYSCSQGKFNITDCSNGFSGNIIDAEMTVENEKIWKIELISDQDITVSGIGSNDLQFFERQRSEENKKLSQAIINSITINGETIAESIERVGTHYPVRISTSGNNIVFRISKKTSTTYDNDFFINDSEDFTICIRNEILIGDILIQPTRWRYDAELKKFVLDNSEDVKNIATSLLKFTGITKEEFDNEGNRIGILLWPSGTSRYVDFYVDSLIRGQSHNSELLTDEHGDAVRKYIYIDGMSINEWLEYGNQYQVMVRFESNYIRFLLDGSREPSMIEDEYHWVEFKDGLVSATGEIIQPCKFYYDPAVKVWKVVESFDGCNKPWWITNFEEKTEFSETKRQNDLAYSLPQQDWNETVISAQKDLVKDSLIESDSSLFEYNDEKYNTSSTNDEETDKREKERVAVTKRKKVKGEVIYENYIPTGLIVAIVAGGILVISSVIVFAAVKSKKKKHLRKGD